MSSNKRANKADNDDGTPSTNTNPVPVEKRGVMETPELLEYIFLYCNVETLKACRLVSKLWNDSARQPWTKSATVKLGRVSPYNDTEEKAVSSFLIKHLQLTSRENNAHIYTNFILQRVRFCLDRSRTVRFFWRACGRHIKYLRLLDCFFPSINTLRNLIFNQCPNLEMLRFDGVTSFESEEEGVVTSDAEPRGENKKLKSLSLNYNRRIPFIEMLRHFPSLEALEITAQNQEVVEKIFSGINTIRQYVPNKLLLKYVSVTSQEQDGPTNNISSALLQFLASPNIELKGLCLSVFGCDASLRLNEILSAHGATLNTIQLEGKQAGVHFDPVDTFPRTIRNQADNLLANLRVLKLKFRVFSSLEFLGFMPNLRELAISDTQDIGIAEMISNTCIEDMQPTKLVHCLELDLGNFVKVDGLEILMALLPNIERVKMQLDNDTFALVCSRWTNLVSLEITCCRVDECGLTGLDEKTVTKINKSKKRFSGKYARAGKANITCLKHLRMLSMECNAEMVDKISLGYAASRFGILELPSIGCVKLTNIKFNPDVLLESFRKCDGNGEHFYIKI